MTVKELYDEINPKYYKSIKSKIDRLTLLINKYVESNKENITTNLINRNVDKIIINEFKNNINFHLKKYLIDFLFFELQYFLTFL